MTKGAADSTKKFLGVCRVEYPEGAFHQTATTPVQSPCITRQQSGSAVGFVSQRVLSKYNIHGNCCFAAPSYAC
jgi:hypothetical protein